MSYLQLASTKPVVITKKQAEIIECSLKSGWSKQEILLKFLKFPVEGDEYTKAYCGFMNMEFDELATILYAGYEVEETPEEKVLKMYQEAKTFVRRKIYTDYNQGTVDAIEMVLRTLKIEIEGVHK